MAVKMVKPMAREEGKLVKRLRTGTSGPITYQGTAEPEGMVDVPAENLLKQILKGVKQEPAAPIIIQETPSMSGINQRLLRATSWNLLELKSVPFVRCFS